MLILIVGILTLHLLYHYILPLFSFYQNWIRLLFDGIFISAFVPFYILFVKRIRERTEAQNQIESMYGAVHSVVWLQETKTKKMIRVSDYVYDLFGYTKEEMLQQSALWKSIIHPDDKGRLTIDNCEQTFIAKDNITRKYRIIRRDGEVRWVQDQIYPIFSEDGELTNIGGVITDITKQEQAAEQARYLYFNDPISKFANYEGLKDTLSHKVKVGQPFAFYIVKVNRLNFIRKHIGQPIAEEVVKILADRIRPILSDQMNVAKISDSRFAVIDEQLRTSKQMSKLLKRFILLVEKPIHVEQYEFFLTATIGITHFYNEGESHTDLQQNAQYALEHARENHEPLAFYEHSMKTEQGKQVQIESDLRKAIDNQELLLHYQPKMNLRTGKLVGVEALIRWAHPNGSMIYPPGFIQLAESTGLILPIGEWVIQEACLQLRKWLDAGINIPSVSINLSVSQLFQQNLAEKIELSLRLNNLPAESLEIEITETMAMDKGNIIKSVTRLKEIGLKISIDDFGTGFSSLHQINNLPIDIVKVDRSFVNEITFDEKAEALISSIIKMTQHLKLETVVEGVETEEQLELLYNNGCEIIQGYLISKPLPPDELTSQITFLQTRLQEMTNRYNHSLMLSENS